MNIPNGKRGQGQAGARGRPLRLVLLGPSLLLAACAADPNIRPIVEFPRPDGTTVKCVSPPPAVIARQTVRSENVDATVKRLGELLKASVESRVQIDPQRIREISADVENFEVVAFRLCEQYGNGILSREEYRKFEEVLPVFRQGSGQPAARLDEGTGWKAVPIASAPDTEGRRAAWEAVSWRDIAWLDAKEGWLAGAVREGGGGGDVGTGLLLHTTDGGETWTETPKAAFDSGSGRFTWGPTGTREYSWTEVGPINAIALYRRHLGQGKFRIEGWLATATGVYASEDGGLRWTRRTPPPDHPQRYAFFFDLASVEAFAEVYAVGWQGIAHWPGGNGAWELQRAAYDYPIMGIKILGGSETRSVWAVGRAGVDEQGNRGSESHGAVYHLGWPANVWELLSLSGIRFKTAQSLNDVLPLDRDTVVAVGDRGLILRGTRGPGGRWTCTRATIPSDAENLLSVARDDQVLWAVGDRGGIYRSPDAGATWTQAHVVTDEKGRGVPHRRVRAGADTVWVLGLGAVLRRIARGS